MHAVRVVIISKMAQLAPEVERVPEEHAIEKFTPNRADQSFNERMRNWGVGNRLDLVDLEYACTKTGASARRKEWERRSHSGGCKGIRLANAVSVPIIGTGLLPKLTCSLWWPAYWRVGMNFLLSNLH